MSSERRQVDPVLDLLPEAFRNEEDLAVIDKVCERVAMESRWTKTDVTHALCRMIHYVVGDRYDN